MRYWLEDLPPRVALGVLDRQLRLDDLALEVAGGVAQAEVADQLLGDRRAALDRACRPRGSSARRGRSPRGRRRRARRSARPRSRRWRAGGSSGCARSRPARAPLRSGRRPACCRRRRRSSCCRASRPACRRRARAPRRRRRAPRRRRRSTPIASRATTPIATKSTLLPAPPRCRWRRRLRCVIGRAYFAPGGAQACVSAVERLWTIPSTSSWLGMTTAVPSPGST